MKNLELCLSMESSSPILIVVAGVVAVDVVNIVVLFMLSPTHLERCSKDKVTPLL